MPGFVQARNFIRNFRSVRMVPFRRSGRWLRLDTLAALALTSVLLAIAAVLWTTDHVILSALYEDFFVPWGAGARWQAGMWPSLDFPSALGPAYYALHGTSYGLSDGSAVAVLRANVIAMALTLPVMAIVLFSRLPPLVAGAALLSFGLWMMSPRQADFDTKTLTHLASYNRHGLIWSSLVLLIASVPWRDGSGRGAARYWQGGVDGAVAGLLLLTCLLTKITFALPTGLFFGVLVLVRHRGDWPRIAVHYGAAAVVILGGLGALEIAAPGITIAYVGDLAYAAGIQSGGFPGRLFSNLGDVIFFELVEIMAAAVAIAAIAVVAGPGVTVRALPVVAGAFAILLVVMGQVHDFYGPFLAITALILFAAVFPALRDAATPREQTLVSLAILPCILFSAALETAAIGQHTFLALRVQNAPDRYVGFPERGLILSQSGGGAIPVSVLEQDPSPSSLAAVRRGEISAETWNRTGQYRAVEWHDLWRDAQMLVTAELTTQARVFCLSFADGCPLVAGTVPPAGLLPWWHGGRSFDVSDPPPGALDDVTALLIPKVDRHGYATGIARAYAAEIDRDFSPVAESDFWRLLRRD
jgi:hypothetical protein